MLTLGFAGIFYEPGKEPSGLEDPPKLHLLVESNEEWRVSCWFRSHMFVLIYSARIGRASCSGDQTSVVRSFCRRVTGGDAQPNRARPLQRHLAADTLCALYDILSLCVRTLLARNTHAQ